MVYYVIIRGPLGVGKTTISGRLAQEIGAVHISIDQILDDRGLWDSGQLSEFLAANAFAVEQARGFLDRGTPVVFDGNFYWKAQIEDLIAKLDFRHFVFTLTAPLSVCIERDGGRIPSHGSEAATEVYAKTSLFEWGVGVDATRSPDAVLSELTALIQAPPHGEPG